MPSGRKDVLHSFNWLQSSTAVPFTPTVLSSTSQILSKPLSIENYDNIAVQYVVLGTPTGTFSLEGSVNHREDLSGNVIYQGQFFGLTSAGAFTASTSLFQVAASSSVQVAMINQSPLSYLRTRYVPSTASSSGLLNIWVEGKQV